MWRRVWEVEQCLLSGGLVGAVDVVCADDEGLERSWVVKSVYDRFGCGFAGCVRVF